MISTESFAKVVAAANLAPSVHNTQPTRWSLWELDGRGMVTLMADLDRRLRVGDPTGRDLMVSVGAALEGTSLALGRTGHALKVVHADKVDFGKGGLQPVVTACIEDGVELPETISGFVERRMTWRRRFVPTEPRMARKMHELIEARDDCSLVVEKSAFALLSDTNEHASLAFFRDKAYREELLSWMRPTKSHERHGVDGLSYAALGMSEFEGRAAGMLLRDPWFDIVDRIGLSGAMISERSRTASALCMIAFHRPVDERPIETGRALYRRQLELAQLGLMTWPMSVLADDPDAAELVSRQIGLADDRRLVTVWRVGSIPRGRNPKRERLPTKTMIV